MKVAYVLTILVFMIVNVFASVPSDCLLPKVTGRCEALFYKFYYNPATQKCEEFVYGGCGGNANNFGSLYECEQKCKS